jgi:hypothetical protein
LRQWFPGISVDHTDRLDVSDGGTVSVDMHWSIGGVLVVCEYDGSFFHLNREDKDFEKTNRLLKSGYSVVRIRERHGDKVLNPLDIRHDRLLQISATYERGHENLELILKRIRDWAYDLAARQELPLEPCV